MQTVKFKLVRFSSKILADKTNPIVLRLTVNNRRYHWSMTNFPYDGLKLSATKKNWIPKDGRYKGDDKRNETLDYIRRRIGTYLDDLRHNKETFTVEGLKECIFVKADSSSFFGLIEAHIKTLEEEDRYSSAETFKNTYSAVKRFRKKDIALSDITVSWIKKFKKFLEPNCKPTTINIYLRCIRRMFNLAIGENLVSSEVYPFGGDGRGKIKIGDSNPKKQELTKNEILSIINADVPPDMKDSQNYFAFSYLMRGMNFMDMALLRWDKHLIDNRIEYVRTKTKDQADPETLSIPIAKRVDEILASYTGSENYIFPIIIDLKLNKKTQRFRIQNARKKANKQIREIAEMVGITKRITFYTARHTYATVLKKHGESVEMIRDLLGHEDIKTTQRYLQKFNQDAQDATQDHLL